MTGDESTRLLALDAAIHDTAQATVASNEAWLATLTDHSPYDDRG